MKKKILLALGALISLNLQANDEFEIYNKSYGPIWFQVSMNPGSTGGISQVMPGKAERKNLDLTMPTGLEIWKSFPTPTDGHRPKGDKFVFPDKKTVYVTWDEKDVLRPQTGPLMGLLGKTKSGLSLKNNVEPRDIQRKA